MYQPKSATNFNDCRKEEIDEEADLNDLLRTFVDDPNNEVKISHALPTSKWMVSTPYYRNIAISLVY